MIYKFKNTDNLPSFLGNYFNDFMNSDLMAKNVFKTSPAVNISETPTGYVVEVAAPGMNKEDFKIEVEKGTLTIKSEKKEEKNDENNRYTRKEFSYSSFSRSFTMPDHVNADAITAEYDKGVLKIQLPKKEEAKQKPVREITVS